MHASNAGWINAHSHEPNPIAPEGDGSFTLKLRGLEQRIALDTLQSLHYSEMPDCYIISTGHGRSGPFCFGGVTLGDFLAQYLAADAQVESVIFVSADGYGTRLDATHLHSVPPPLLAYRINNAPMKRAQGLVRLIVPTEREDALHQVKWLQQVSVNESDRT